MPKVRIKKRTPLYKHHRNNPQFQQRPYSYKSPQPSAPHHDEEPILLQPAPPPSPQRKEQQYRDPAKLWKPMRWEDQRNTLGHIPFCHRTPLKRYQVDHYIDCRGKLRYKPANPLRFPRGDMFVTHSVTIPSRSPPPQTYPLPSTSSPPPTPPPPGPTPAEILSHHLYQPLSPPHNPLPKTFDVILPPSFQEFQQKLKIITPLYPIPSVTDATKRMIIASTNPYTQYFAYKDKNNWERRMYGTFGGMDDEYRRGSLMADLEAAGVDFVGEFLVREEDLDWEGWWEVRGWVTVAFALAGGLVMVFCVGVFFGGLGL